MPSFLSITVLAAVASLAPPDQGIYQAPRAGGARVPWALAPGEPGLALPAARRLGTVMLAGCRQVHWQVADGGGSFAAWLYYSPDAGAHWRLVGAAEGLGAQGSMAVDFDGLPGSAAGAARLRVVVSDGVQFSDATSAPFTVARKRPQDLLIVSPGLDSTVAAGAQVRLEGSAFDADDGVLLGQAIAWHSDRDGPLGRGIMLRTSALSVGRHRLTMTATDSDGNAASASVDLRVEAL